MKTSTVTMGKFKESMLANGKTQFEIEGLNSNNQPVRIRITVDEYMFPQMIKAMAKISKQRLQSAIREMDAVKDAINV